MNRFLKSLAPFALAALGLGYTGTAAAADQENVIVVLDASGTMQQAGDASGTSKWEISKQRARDFVNLPHTDREYELWSFSGSSWIRHYSFADGAGKTVGQRQAEMINAINAASVTPYTTPLAMTVCDAIDTLIAHEQLVFPPPRKRIMLQTDGLENASPATHPCNGPASAAQYDASITPRGGLTPDSWEWKVLNKGITGSPSGTGNPPAGFEVIADITALFDYIPSMSVGSFSVAEYETVAPISEEIGPMGATTYSEPLSLAAVAYFKGLAQKTGGRYTQIDPATPPPTPGDVDSSGCTDYADYVQVMQWYGQPVTEPHSDLADLTRDGWVNYNDYLVVVQNWGSGPTC